MGTPFEDAGYTKDTVFEILYDQQGFTKGDLVILEEDCGSICPYFTVCGSEVGGYAYLPGESLTEEEDLKLHSNQGFIPITKDLLGEPGSDKYEAIRLVLKVLNGDELKYRNFSYCDETLADLSVIELKKLEYMLSAGQEYTLKSEDETEKQSLKEQEKQRKIQELEDNIKKAQEQIAELTGY